MQSWYHIFPKNPWLNIYTWIIFSILPFFFIFRSFSFLNVLLGIIMIGLFFLAYRFSFITKSWLAYVWIGLKIAISVSMTVIFGYVYFSLFIAFIIGNIRNKVGFFILYGLHLLFTLVAVGLGTFYKQDLFISQFPFVLICIIGVILLPFNLYNRNKREKLEEQLEDANKKISQLLVFEERQRIARDLHDTLGQKLSLIGLKSDLASKLIDRNASSAKKEIKDVQQTARSALKEVRELVVNMRRVQLTEEMVRIRQILEAAQIKLTLRGHASELQLPLLLENILSMCLKEAVTNIVKHSDASACSILLQQSPDEVRLEIRDNGIGFSKGDCLDGHGLQGMRERLEFVNGNLDILSTNGTSLVIRVPTVIKQTLEEGLL